MKRLGMILVTLAIVMGLVGCGSQVAGGNTSEEIASTTDITKQEAAPAETARPETAKPAETEHPAETAAPVETPRPAKLCHIDFADAEACFRETVETVKPMSFTLVSEQQNNVSQIQDWFTENELFLPMLGEGWQDMAKAVEDAPVVDTGMNLYGNIFYDDNYIYNWTTSALNIYDRTTKRLLYGVTYETEQWYLMGNCAYLRDGILYIGAIYNGYAMPGTCYLLAYDLEKDEVVWRSEDQTYNTMNFIVNNDIIICGYGFTDEKDYLFQIDMNSGKILAQTELKKMPDMLVEKDGQLYVHTYSYDYVFDMK